MEQFQLRSRASNGPPTLPSEYEVNGHTIRSNNDIHNATMNKFSASLDAARLRLEKYQQRWSEIGEELPPQINRRPNVGGPVGLAGLYVDPALGFALGWNAWYSWAIILPTELSAATILFNGFFPNGSAESINTINLITISVFLVLAIGINCFGSRAYGEAEFSFSCFKILTVVSLVLGGIILDLGGGTEGFIGLKNWRNPGPFVEFRAKGTLGRFLGVWSSMIQAVFAFSGTEIPGVAAGEVQNPAKVIQVTSVLALTFPLLNISSEHPSCGESRLDTNASGLLVRSDDPRLTGPTIGSPGHTLVLSSPFVIAMQNARLKHLEHIYNAAFVISAFSAATSDVYISSRFLYYLARCGHAPRFCAAIFRNEANKTIIPWVGILASACFALMAFMSLSRTRAEEIFHWLSSLNSTTALLSWIGMLFTYLRWYQGTIAAEKKDKDFKQTHQELYKNRYRMQPWVSCLVYLTVIPFRFASHESS
uniref:Amino acid permease/ SLC12A domain-containing protein n=1 Tax=Psilocybe cubensis TaxID=181762 RepID=A0A8H8CKQ2_PSICU